MKKTTILILLLAASVASFAVAPHPSIYIEAQNGFDTYIAAAIAKKQVPLDVVTDQTKATYVLKAAPVEIKQESTAEKSRVACSPIVLVLRTKETSPFNSSM